MHDSPSTFVYGGNWQCEENTEEENIYARFFLHGRGKYHSDIFAQFERVEGISIRSEFSESGRGDRFLAKNTLMIRLSS